MTASSVKLMSADVIGVPSSQTASGRSMKDSQAVHGSHDAWAQDVIGLRHCGHCSAAKTILPPFFWAPPLVVPPPEELDLPQAAAARAMTNMMASTRSLRPLADGPTWTSLVPGRSRLDRRSRGSLRDPPIGRCRRSYPA